jgi:hypothetical protein
MVKLSLCLHVIYAARAKCPRSLDQAKTRTKGIVGQASPFGGKAKGPARTGPFVGILAGISSGNGPI